MSLSTSPISMSTSSIVGAVCASFGVYGCWKLWRNTHKSANMWPQKRQCDSETPIVSPVESNIVLVGATDGIGLALAIRYFKQRQENTDASITNGVIYIVGRRDKAELLKQYKEEGNNDATAMFTAVDNTINNNNHHHHNNHHHNIVTVRYIQIDLLNSNCGVQIAAQVDIEIDLLVYLASTAKVGPMLKESEASIRNTLQVNLTSPALVCKAMLFKMGLARQEGVTVSKRIVLVSSVTATLGRPMFATYVASKAALGMFGWSLGSELRGSNIDVHIVHPGATKTSFFNKCGVPKGMLNTSNFETTESVATNMLNNITHSSRLSSVHGSMSEQFKFLIGGVLPTSSWPLSVMQVAASFSKLLIRANVCGQPSHMVAGSLSHINNAIVTGAARGLGHSIVEKLLEHSPATVYAYDIRDQEATSQPSRVKPISVDLASLGLEKKLEDATVATPCLPNHAVELVVCNAGVNFTGRVTAISDDKFVTTTNINLSSVIVLVNAVLRHNAKHNAPPPTVVLVSSLSHYFSYPGGALYGATKEGLVSYAKSLRAHTNGQAQVTCVFPGPMRTQMAWDCSPNNDDARVEARVHPDDAAETILACVANGDDVAFVESQGIRTMREKAAHNPEFGSNLMINWQLKPMIERGLAFGIDVGI